MQTFPSDVLWPFEVFTVSWVSHAVSSACLQLSFLWHWFIFFPAHAHTPLSPIFENQPWRSALCSSHLLLFDVHHPFSLPLWRLNFHAIKRSHSQAIALMPQTGVFCSKPWQQRRCLLFPGLTVGVLKVCCQWRGLSTFAEVCLCGCPFSIAQSNTEKEHPERLDKILSFYLPSQRSK